MPELDIRGPNGGLLPQARWKIVSIMVAPRPEWQSEHDELLADHTELDYSPIFERLRNRHFPGFVAGQTLRELIGAHEAHVNGHSEVSDTRVSLNVALNLAAMKLRFCNDGEDALSGYPPPSESSSSTYKAFSTNRTRANVSRKHLLQIWNQYRPVAHFWAALLVFDDVKNAEGISEAFSDRGLFHFIGTAHAILDRAQRLPWTRHPRERQRAPLLPENEAWRVRIPDGITINARLELQPKRET